MSRIVIYGQARHGKDTLASYLTSRIRQRTADRQEWARVGFTTDMKAAFCRDFGVDLDFLERWKVRRDEIPPGFGVPIRKALQDYGQLYREIQPDYWLSRLFQRQYSFIAADGRHIHEIQRAKAAGAYNILLLDPRKINNDPHLSEAELRTIIDKLQQHHPDYCGPAEGLGNPWFESIGLHYILLNDGDLLRLFYRADQLMLPHVEKVLGLELLPV